MTFDDVVEVVGLTLERLDRFKYIMNTTPGFASDERIYRDLDEVHFQRAIYMALQVDPSEDAVKKLFDRLDVNGDGNLGEDELYDSHLADFFDD